MIKKSLLSLSLCSSLLYANEAVVDEFDAMDGFDDAFEEVTITVPQKLEKKSPLSINGKLAFKTAYAYKEHQVDSIDYNGFTQAQSSLSLELSYKLSDDYKLHVSSNGYYDLVYLQDKSYPDEIVDSYKAELVLSDTYIEGKITQNLDIKIGRQIVIWGKSDSIRVTDVINPLDNRTPGLTDIEDLRLPTTMAKFDYYFGNWNISAMIIGESRIMEEAPPRSEFFPVDKVFPIQAPKPFFELQTPESSFNNMQYALSVNGVFSGWDLSLYNAYILDQKWHINTKTQKRVVSTVNMLGSAFNIVHGSWLLKSEIAYLRGVAYNTTQDEKNRLDSLIGFDYMGIKDSVISVELGLKYIFNYESQMAQGDYVDKTELQTALRYTQSFYNDTLDFTTLLSMFGNRWQNGGFSRVWIKYELANATNVNIGIIEYIGGDKPFMESIAGNDRFYADITYSF